VQLRRVSQYSRYRHHRKNVLPTGLLRRVARPARRHISENKPQYTGLDSGPPLSLSRSSAPKIKRCDRSHPSSNFRLRVRTSVSLPTRFHKHSSSSAIVFQPASGGFESPPLFGPPHPERKHHPVHGTVIVMSSFTVNVPFRLS